MKKSISVLLLMMASCLLFSQEVVMPAGGQLYGSGGQASYTVGQVAYYTLSSGGTSSEGVQQPFEYLMISGEVVIIEHHSGTMLICENNDGRWSKITWYCDEELVEVNNYIYEEDGLNGIYYAVVTDAYGREYYSERYYYSTDIPTTKSLLIYPLPVEEGQNLNVFYKDQKNDGSELPFQVFELGGKLVRDEYLVIGESYSLNTSGLKEGVYLVIIDNEVSKIIVQ